MESLLPSVPMDARLTDGLRVNARLSVVENLSRPKVEGGLSMQKMMPLILNLSVFAGHSAVATKANLAKKSNTRAIAGNFSLNICDLNRQVWP